MFNATTARPESDIDSECLSRISLCGKTLKADLSGAVYWADMQALIVADLHLEKGSSFARRGAFFPPYDTRSTLAKITRAIAHYRPKTVIALGDSLHDREAADRIATEDLELILELQDGRDWYWITGNHDPEIPGVLGGQVADQIWLGGLCFRHQPFEGPATHEIAGHLHPAARVALRGHALRRPCFVSNGRRLVLPAFGSYAGGLNVLSEAYQPLFAGEALHVWMLGQEGIYPVAARQLRSD